MKLNTLFEGFSSRLHKAETDSSDMDSELSASETKKALLCDYDDFINKLIQKLSDDGFKKDNVRNTINFAHSKYSFHRVCFHFPNKTIFFEDVAKLENFYIVPTKILIDIDKNNNNIGVCEILTNKFLLNYIKPDGVVKYNNSVSTKPLNDYYFNLTNENLKNIHKAMIDWMTK